MRTNELYKILNRKERKKEKILYLIIFLSIMISVSISLVIPCIKNQTNDFCKENAEILNGGELKVETAYEDEKWEDYFKNLDKDECIISKNQASSVTMENKDNYIYCSMITGNYDIEKNEVILSKRLAEAKDAKIGDIVKLAGKSYVVKEIEENAKGVDAQSELIGYCKTVQGGDTVVPYAYIYTVSNGNIKEITKKLDKDFKQFSYTTAAHKEEDLKESLNLNIVSLNVLNTMSFVFTLLSIGSSIIMILIRRQREIAILKTLSIRNTVIQAAFLREIEEILIGAVILSAGIGPIVANIVLKTNGFSALTWNIQIIKVVGCGVLLNIFLYSVFSYIIVSVIRKIDPIEVLKNNSESVWKEKKWIFLKAFLFLIMAFILYAMYLKNTAALFSSVLLVLFILIMSLVILIVISIWCRFPVRRDMNRYFRKNIRRGKGIFVISIVSFAMTIWFLFMGYTFVETVYDSYEQSSSQELEYNYMVFGDDTLQLEKALKDLNDTVQYTKMRKKAVFLNQEDGTYQAASLCFVTSENYDVPFQMKEGKALGEGSSSEVLISDDMAEENKLSIGDNLCIQTENEEKKVTVKGIYISGGINKNYILTEEEISHTQMDLFLVKTNQPDFEKNLEDVTIVQVSTLALSVMNMFEKYLNMFRNLVFVSIFNSILFNCIIVCINSKMQEKYYAIMHAIGISKKELYKIEVKKYGLTVVFSFGMAVVLYLIISKLCIQLLFQIDIYLKASTFLGPAIMAAIFVGIIYIIPIYRIRRGIDYEILRIE